MKNPALVQPYPHCEQWAGFVRPKVDSLWWRMHQAQITLGILDCYKFRNRYTFVVYNS